MVSSVNHNKITGACRKRYHYFHFLVGFLITLWLTREDFVLSPSEAYEKIKQQGFDDGQPKVVKCVKELWSGKSIFDLFPLEQKVADACNLAVAQVSFIQVM